MMLYLSRLLLDTRNRHVRRDLNDCHQLHRTMLGAFPQAPDGSQARAQFGLLYRVEPIDGMPMLRRLLLQSNIAPDWSHLPAGYLDPAPDTRGNPSLRPIRDEYDQIIGGMRLYFRLRANPTKRINNRRLGLDTIVPGKRVALLTEEEQFAWLARKGQDHGFQLVTTAAHPELLDVRASAQWQDRGRRPPGAATPAMPLHFGAVVFSGWLEVTDRTSFHAALAHGIGSGKAFGFGLLSVAAVG